MFDFLKKKITAFTEKVKETLQNKTITQSGQKEEMPPTEGKTQEIVQTNSQEVPEQQSKEQTEIPKNQETDGKKEFDRAGEKRPEDRLKHVRGDKKRELRAKKGILTKLTGIIDGKIKISEKDTKEFFEELELSLLEADVEIEASRAIVSELEKRLIGAEIKSNQDITQVLKREVKNSLLTIMQTKQIEILKLQKPAKILFLGPNGAGKTTTIAKLANYLISKGKTVIIAAGDTFRAASIEQLEAHAKKLGVKVIKHNYGSDPAAVAFDALKAAVAKGIDYVLIDSAGRQETNMNLLEELKKIERVVKPDLKIYIGEAYTGQALVEQAREFDKAIGIDAFILTKIDTDAKGGTAISLLYTLKKPIIFVGSGQRYEDLLEFKPEFIIERII